MKKRFFLWLLCVALLTFGVYCAESLVLQRGLAAKTVRLHVVANSDSAADQAQKLRVRDAVVRHVAMLTADCENAEAAKAVIGANLNDLTKTAQGVLDAEGSGYSALVTLQTERFDTRRYDTFTLPAGSYPSLRVRIGAAEGKNWWCVVFPSLCEAATSEDMTRTAQVGGFEEGQTALITGGEEKYTLRFKTLEWLKKLSDRLK